MSYGISERQLEFLNTLCRQVSVAESTLLHEINRTGRRGAQPVESFAGLTREQATWAIDLMVHVRDGKRPAPVPPGQRSFFRSDPAR